MPFLGKHMYYDVCLAKKEEKSDSEGRLEGHPEMEGITMS
jgi:hypothetical protein